MEHTASVRVASARVKESLHRGILGPCGVRQGADIFDEEGVCSCLVRRKVPGFGVLAHGGNGGFFQRALSFFPWYPSLLVLVFSAARASLLAVLRGCSLVLCFGDDLGCSLGDALHFFFGGRLGLQCTFLLCRWLSCRVCRDGVRVYQWCVRREEKEKTETSSCSPFQESEVTDFTYLVASERKGEYGEVSVFQGTFFETEIIGRAYGRELQCRCKL